MIELIIALCLALGTPAPGSNGGVSTQDTGGQTGQTPPPPPPPPHG